MFQWVVGVKENVLVCVCRFLLDFNIKATVLLDLHSTVQERQPILFDVFPSELDVAVHRVHVFREGFHFLGLDFDPGVVHKAEPMAQSYYLKVR